MSDPLELELQMVVGCYVGAGIKPGNLQEQQVLLNTKPALQLVFTKMIFYDTFCQVDD